MTVPLNSAVMNGGARPAVWAEGVASSVSEASATVDRYAYAIPDAATAEVSGGAAAIRWARVGGDALARVATTPLHPQRITPAIIDQSIGPALSSGVPYRARQVDGLPSTSRAEIAGLEPCRIVRIPPGAKSGGPINGEALNGAPSWQQGLLAVSEAAASNQLIGARIISAKGDAVSIAQTSRPDAPITRNMTPHLMRTASLAFIRGQDAEKIRVRQVPAGGPAIARAESRATPNTILGYGWSYCDAETVIHDDHIYIARAVYPSPSFAHSEATTQSHLVRIVEFSLRASASTVASPDIIRDGVRQAYASGAALSESSASSPIARRFPLFTPDRCLGVSASSGVPRFEPRSRTAYKAFAGLLDVDEMLEILHRVPVKAALEARSVARAAAAVARDGRGGAESWASMSASATRLVARNSTGVMRSSAQASGDNVATLVAAGYSEGCATADGEALRSAFMKSSVSGKGCTSVSAQIYTIISTRPEVASPVASSKGVAIRQLVALPAAAIGESATAPRSFKINAGDPAPGPRTLTLAAASRGLVIPHTIREYLIT